MVAGRSAQLPGCSQALSPGVARPLTCPMERKHPPRCTLCWRGCTHLLGERHTGEAIVASVLADTVTESATQMVLGYPDAEPASV